MSSTAQSASEAVAKRFEAEEMTHLGAIARAASRLLWDPAKAECSVREVFPEAWTCTPPVARQRTGEDMLAAFDRAPADFRTVILVIDINEFSYIDEFSYKKAAGILGIPIGAVMPRSSGARALLRGCLAGVAQSYRFGKAKQKGQTS